MTLAKRFLCAGPMAALLALVVSLAPAPGRPVPQVRAAPDASSLSTTIFLGFYGDTCPNYPDYAICNNGGIANTGFTEVLSGTNPVDLSKITLDPTSGRLSIQSTAGDLRTPATPQDNAIVIPFDGNAAPFTIGARLLGPFGAITQNGQGGGIVLGLDADNYARLVVGREGGTSGALFSMEKDGALSGTNEALNLASITTLDLFLTVDTVGKTLSALYRANSNDPANVTLITTIAWPDALITSPIAGGLVTSNGAAPPITFTYDWFKLGSPVSGISFEGPVKIIDSATPGNAGFARPTTLALGPDGRLYAGTQSGRIYAYTLNAQGQPTEIQVYNEIYQKVNHTCDSNQAEPPPPDPCPPDGSVVGRHLMGIVFDPASTADDLTLYVSHSDPRTYYGPPLTDPLTTARRLDTRSGTITRLKFNGPNRAVSEDTDILTGLPRSRPTHATNGLAFGPDGWLYIAQGSNTNQGAPNPFFSFLPEYYLSATVLRLNVAALGPAPASINARPVLTSTDMLALDGQFEIYATGVRNPYDLVWHSNDKLYVNVNAGNATFGNTPGPADGCPNGQSTDLSPTPPDVLEWVRPGDYFGHPNPLRGECVWEGGVYTPDYNLTPLPNYQPPVYSYTASLSVDGIAEYTSNAFNGGLRGNLITAAYAGDHAVRRLVLSADGETVLNDIILTQQISHPLDVAVAADGRIYIANILEPDNVSAAIYALNPRPIPPACPAPGSDPAVTDNDNDGFIDQDELDNGTDICSPSSAPVDFDADKLSDLHDPDSDNDGALNNQDQLQYDGTNGGAITLPLMLDFLNETRGIQQSGFDGVQLRAGASRTLVGNDGHGFGLYQPDQRIRTDDAAGSLSLLATSGSNQGATNTQDNALQVGFDATGSFTVSAELANLFAGRTEPVTSTEEAAIFFGLDADNHVKLVLRRTDAGSMQSLLVAESGGVALEGAGQLPTPAIMLPFTGTVQLALVGNPAGTGYVAARYRVVPPLPDQPEIPWTTIGVVSIEKLAGLPQFFQAPACSGASATGCVATAGILATGPDVPFIFNDFQIRPSSAPPQIFALRLPIAAR